jgi:4-carboxymuconolactone decarboxylase
LDPKTKALILLAAAVARGAASQVKRRSEEAVAAGVPVVWGDELVLQSVLMAGYPRALAAAHAWRDATGRPPAEEEDGGNWQQAVEWRRRGEETCRLVYGENYDKLRANVAGLHPSLDAWMVAEGYGRTLSRPGLDLVRRELCVIAQVTVLGAERQLHSHFRGALNAGAAPATIEAALGVIAEEAGPAEMASATALWRRILR